MGPTPQSLESQEACAMQGHGFDHESAEQRLSSKGSFTYYTTISALVEFQVITISVLPRTRISQRGNIFNKICTI